MKHERYVGFEIKALSNLLRRRLWGSTDHPHGVLTEIEGVLIGYLCHSQDRGSTRRIWSGRCASAAPLPPVC